MYIAFIDESGDIGLKGSKTYSLGCVLMPAHDWPDCFDRFIGFRRELRKNFGVPVRAELKANYLIRNGGPLRANPLSDKARRSIALRHLRMVPNLGLLAFAVVIDKPAAATKYPDRDAREISWEWLLQRLERFTTKSHKEPVLIVHDEGENHLVRGFARRARRAGTAGSKFGAGLLNRPARLLVDDPVPRRSHESYFVQLADIVAYSAFRRIYPPPPIALLYSHRRPGIRSAKESIGRRTSRAKGCLASFSAQCDAPRRSGGHEGRPRHPH